MQEQRSSNPSVSSDLGYSQHEATSFLYDGWDVVQEQHGGNPSADLILGMGIDERFQRAGATLLTDALGSTAALVSSAGSIQTSYGYDAYGVTQATGAASTNTFQFTGRENDGTGLYNYRNRYYNPTWGRFISEDPVGLGRGDDKRVVSLCMRVCTRIFSSIPAKGFCFLRSPFWLDRSQTRRHRAPIGVSFGDEMSRRGDRGGRSEQPRSGSWPQRQDRSLHRGAASFEYEAGVRLDFSE